jgi:hypothetical protein
MTKNETANAPADPTYLNVKPRTLRDVAMEVRRDWKHVYFGAVPYLDAMMQMNDTPATRDGVKGGNYYADSAQSVILYFLANANTWRGETARRVKAELKALSK